MLCGIYSLLLKVRQFLPASEDRELKLGAKLALVARFQTPDQSGEEDAIATTDAMRVRAALAWANFVAAGASGADLSLAILTPCFRIINSHMTRRASFMKAILAAGGLSALHPLFLAQAQDVISLLEEAPGRHQQAYPKGSDADDARMRNEGYYDLLCAFFKDIAGVRVVPGRFGHAALLAAAETRSPRARTMLQLGLAAPTVAAVTFTPAPASTAAAWPPPPPAYSPPAPPAPAPPPPHPVVAAAPRPQKVRRDPPLSPAGSAAMVGPALAIYPAPQPGKGCRCAVYATAPHWYFECPLRLATLFGHPCPGFDAAGSRAPGDWAGADLCPAACARWRALVSQHRLTGPRMTNGGVPAF
jgi:hypothetical protein